MSINQCILLYLLVSYISSCGAADLKRIPIPRTKLKNPPTIIPNAPDGAKIKKNIQGDYIITWKNQTGKTGKVIYCPGNKIDVFIVSKLVQNDDLYEYKYSINNMPTSTQDVWVFELDIHASINEAKKPRDWVLLGPKKHGLPEGWERWRWFGIKGKYVKPGNTLDDISYRSKELPGIIGCYLEGYSIPITSNIDLPNGIEDALDNMSITHGFVGSVGKTLGPYKVKEPIDPLEFLKNISSMIDESLNLGWMDEPKTRDAIKQFLDKAASQIKMKHHEQAKAEMCQAITFVNDELDKTVTPEVQAIVKYNLEFLIKKLP